MKLKGELKTSLNDNHKDDKEILVGEEFPYRWTSIRIFRKLLSTDLDSFFELLTSLLFCFVFLGIRGTSLMTVFRTKQNAAHMDSVGIDHHDDSSFSDGLD